MEDTNWDQAWKSFLAYETDRNLKIFGFGDTLSSRDEDLDEISSADFIHILPPNRNDRN